MRERSIIFSAESVKAILDGRKIMTRRVVKNHPLIDAGFTLEFINDPGNAGTCPYGQPGDRPWVKEAWRVGAWSEDLACIAVDYRADGFCRKEWLTVPDDEVFNRLWEESTQEAEKALGRQERYLWKPGESPCRWRSPIFMPRWASRITLEITDVRVERLQEISEADARTEGLISTAQPEPFPSLDYRGLYAREHFRLLWDSLNKKRGFGWETNPHVWAISFKRIEEGRKA